MLEAYHENVKVIKVKRATRDHFQTMRSRQKNTWESSEVRQEARGLITKGTSRCLEWKSAGRENDTGYDIQEQGGASH